MFEVVASVSFTAFGNVTGLPAVSLPLHWTDEGLPVGVQLVGRPLAGGRCSVLAAQLERARPWASQRPPVARRRLAEVALRAHPAACVQADGRIRTHPAAPGAFAAKLGEMKLASERHRYARHSYWRRAGP